MGVEKKNQLKKNLRFTMKITDCKKAFLNVQNVKDYEKNIKTIPARVTCWYF